jgi:small conductance mechanosensitive channel
MPEAISTSVEQFVSELILFVPKLIVALIIFLAAFYVAGLVAKAVRTGLIRRHVDSELTLLLTRVSRWSVVILGIIWALAQVNFDVTGFVAGLGILGFTVGFALQDIAKNFVAGILLLWQQPFDIGEAISAGGHSGVVEDIQIRATTIRTWDGLLVLVPNADVLTSAITNYSKVQKRRLEVVVGVGYETDLPKAHQLLLDVIANIPGVISDDPAPIVVFKEFGDSSINATVYFWIDMSKTGYFDALDAAIKDIKAAFEREGINIPYPIRMMYMENVSSV